MSPTEGALGLAAGDMGTQNLGSFHSTCPLILSLGSSAFHSERLRELRDFLQRGTASHTIFRQAIHRQGEWFLNPG